MSALSVALGRNNANDQPDAEPRGTDSDLLRRTFQLDNPIANNEAGSVGADESAPRGLASVSSRSIEIPPSSVTDTLDLPGSGSLLGSPGSHSFKSSVSPGLLSGSPSLSQYINHRAASSSSHASRRPSPMGVSRRRYSNQTDDHHYSYGTPPVGSPYYHSRGSTPTGGRRRYSNIVSNSTSATTNASAVTAAAVAISSLSNGSSEPIDEAANNSAGSLDRDASGSLNAGSPLALAAAAQVTPDKLSRLLLTQGPLAIRHITGHLALTIKGFADLSLSKQRRLIIAALDSGDTVNNVVFEKVGWGRWAAKKSDSKLLLSKQARRESISSSIVTGVKPPVSPSLRPQISIRNMSTSTDHKPVFDDIDLAEDDMMFHNSSSTRKKGSSRSSATARRSAQTSVFDDYDEAIRDSDEDSASESDEDSFESDEEAYLSSRRMNDKSGYEFHHGSLKIPNAEKPVTGETDDEDWKSIGAESLRGNPVLFKRREQEAVDALVKLGSV